jgi:flagellar protein FliO/FliZ
MKPLTYNRGAWLVYACTLLSTLTLVLGDPVLAFAANKGCAYNQCKPVNLTSGDANAATSSGTAGGSIVRTIVGLAIVIAVIYGLTSLPMGTNRSVALVRVGAELHLLGISEHGVTGIRVYSEEEAYELGLPLEAPEDGDDVNGGGPPIDRLMRLVKRFTVR